MTRIGKGILEWVLTLLFAATILPAQSGPASPPERQTKSQGGAPAQSDGAKPVTSSQPARLELAPVSTSETARGAAREIAKRQPASQAKSADTKSQTDESRRGAPDSSAVDEFKPGRPVDSTDDAVVVKGSKKSAGKNVHGTAYGSLDPTARGNRETGGSAGATSKGGKTSVYVETDSSHATSSSH